MAGSDEPGKPPYGEDREEKTQDESPQPAADDRSRGRFVHGESAQDKTATSEIEALMQRAEATMTLASAWSENFTRLVQLEFQRTLSAGKHIALLLLLLFFLAVALIVSLCAGLGLLSYFIFQSIYVGFGIFILSQVLVVGGLLLSVNSLRKLLGFEESKKQAKEALDDVTALFKQAD